MAFHAITALVVQLGLKVSPDVVSVVRAAALIPQLPFAVARVLGEFR